jgi:hypothetical protein
MIKESHAFHPLTAALDNGLTKCWHDLLLACIHLLKLFVPLQECTQSIGAAVLDILKTHPF